MKIFFGISGSGQTVGSALYTMDDLPARRAKLTKELAETQSGAPTLLHFRPTHPVRIESVGLIESNKLPDDDTVALLRKAGEACLASSQYEAAEIELLIQTGVYRSEFLMEPALATIAAGELGMNDDESKLARHRTFAFDLVNGAVGTLDGCFAAAQMLAEDRFGTAMILATEIENNTEPFHDSHMGIQETGSALVLERSNDDAGFIAFGFRAFPQYLELCNTYTTAQQMVPTLGIERDPALEEKYLECIAETVTEFLAKEEKTIDDIDIVLPPMMSADFVQRLCEQLGIPIDRCAIPDHNDNDWFTSSLAKALSSIHAQDANGKLGLAISVGAGVQVGCALYRFDECKRQS